MRSISFHKLLYNFNLKRYGFLILCCFSFGVYLLILLQVKGIEPNLEQIRLLEEKLKKIAPYKLKLKNPNINHLGEVLMGGDAAAVMAHFTSNVELIGINNRPDYPIKQLIINILGNRYQFEEGRSIPLIDLGFKLPVFNKYLVSFKVLASGISVHLHPINGSPPIRECQIKSYHLNKGAMVGPYLLDSHLLSRMQCMWLGVDDFIQSYAKDSYPEFLGLERLTFNLNQKKYLVFAKPKEVLSFKDGFWQKGVVDSQNYPLLQIDHVEGSLVHISVWDKSGLNSMKFTVSKSKSRILKDILAPLKFIGARSKSVWLIKDGNRRIVVKRGDWLLHADKKWQKVDHASSLEQYVQSTSLGELFIVKELKEKKGAKFLVGEIIDKNKTSHEEMELALK